MNEEKGNLVKDLASVEEGKGIMEPWGVREEEEKRLQGTRVITSRSLNNLRANLYTSE